jgi:DNA-binding transcriptional LysR family regulator
MLPNLDIDLMRSFNTVAELKNFTRAATTLHRTQSTISAQIRRIEDLTGLTLLERSPQKVTLTRAGEDFLAYSRRIVALHDEALAGIRAKELTGRVRLAVMDDYATFVLPDIIAEFCRIHPGVELEVTTGFTRDLLGGLGDPFDLVLATQKGGDGRGHVLKIEQTAWACADSYTLDPDRPLPIALLSAPNMFREWALESLNAAGIAWRILFSSSSIGAVEAMAASGACVTIVKRGTARPGLRLLGLSDGFPNLPPSEIALHSTPERQSPSVQSFTEFLVGALRRMESGGQRNG